MSATRPLDPGSEQHPPMSPARPARRARATTRARLEEATATSSDTTAVTPIGAELSATFTELELTTSDGLALGARHYAPRRGDIERVRARGAVLLVPAMGVPQRFYESLATWLAGEGFHVLTFDYRGMGASRRRPLRDEPADILTWAERDVPAALEALERRAPGLPVTWIGHSLGGQIVPFVPGHERVAKVVTIATGSGYWRDNTPALRRRVWLFWYGFVPALTPLFGYFPGARLGLVGDLPRGVIRQWRRWCMDPDYLVGVVPSARERFAALNVPLTSLSFTDDEMMSERSIASIHRFYSATDVRMQRFAPADLGVRRVGHFGAFRHEMRATLWETRLAPELARVGARVVIP